MQEGKCRGISILEVRNIILKLPIQYSDVHWGCIKFNSCMLQGGLCILSWFHAKILRWAAKNKKLYCARGKNVKKQQQEYSLLPVDRMVRPKDDLDLGNKFGVREFSVPLQGSTDVPNCFHEKKNRP